MVAKVKKIFGYDDALDAFGVHGIGGTLGALLTGVFATKEVNDLRMGKAMGWVDGDAGQMMNQIIAVLIAWGLAIWVSAYEPLVLFGIVVAVSLSQDRRAFLAKSRRTGWISFALIIVGAALIERRIPSMSISSPNEIFNNWARTVGELAHVSPLNPIWFSWTGYMIAVAPLLIWFALRRRNGDGLGQRIPPLIIVLLIASYFLTIWQARWAYFFVSIFATALPSLLDSIKSRTAVWIAFVMSIFPILRDWDARLWPNEIEYARRIEQRNESVQLRDLSINLL